MYDHMPCLLLSFTVILFLSHSLIFIVPVSPSFILYPFFVGLSTLPCLLSTFIFLFHTFFYTSNFLLSFVIFVFVCCLVLLPPGFSISFALSPSQFPILFCLLVSFRNSFHFFLPIDFRNLVFLSISSSSFLHPQVGRSVCLLIPLPLSSIPPTHPQIKMKHILMAKPPKQKENQREKKGSTAFQNRPHERPPPNNEFMRTTQLSWPCCQPRSSLDQSCTRFLCRFLF